MIESFNNVLAHKTRKRYLCATCWGELEIIPDPSQSAMYFVTCKTCKEETRGYVSRYYVEHRRGESEGEKHSVTILMRKLGIIPTPPRQTVGKNLKDLGF